MPSSYAEIPLTYKGTDLQESDLSLFFEIEEGLDELADYRGSDLPLVGADGQYEGVRRPDRRMIVLVGWVREANGSDFRDALQALQALFDPTTPGDLVATLEDSATATIRARALVIAPMGPKIGQTRRYRIVLVSIAPEWTIT